jgi:Fe-Mn family superoxide dismutase
MKYQAKDFSSLLGMKGFSDRLLKDHFSLYEGYVTHVNALLEKLGSLREQEALDGAEQAELRRRLGYEFDGMRLHELYFGNLGGEGRPPARGQVREALDASFGSTGKWAAEYRAVGAMRGVGWAILSFDPETGNLANFWVGEHEVGHAAGCTPLLVMDVWEHAFMTDYGTDRGSYIESFLLNVDWKEVERRLSMARSLEASFR